MWITAFVSNDDYCKPQNAPGRNHAWPLSRWMTLVVFQPMGIFRFWRNGESLFFSKDVNTPSMYPGPHPLPCRVFSFPLASSSLAILSKHSTIKWKYEKIEHCEQSRQIQDFGKGSLRYKPPVGGAWDMLHRKLSKHGISGILRSTCCNVAFSFFIQGFDWTPTNYISCLSNITSYVGKF